MNLDIPNMSSNDAIQTFKSIEDAHEAEVQELANARARLAALIVKCRKKTDICPCDSYVGLIGSLEEVAQHCERLDLIIERCGKAQNPYSKWTKDDLKSFLEGRDIVVPKQRTKRSLVAALVKADKSRRFRLFDLPLEIRLRVYAFALKKAPKQIADDIREEKPLREPALLQTCHQVRAEAKDLFYRVNCCYLHAEPNLILKEFQPHAVSRLMRIGPSNVANLRRVRFMGIRNTDVEVKLCRKNPTLWIVHDMLDDGYHQPTCENELMSPSQFADFYQDQGTHEYQRSYVSRQSARLDVVVEAEDFIRRYKTLCENDGSFSPTVEGLQILAEFTSMITSRIWSVKQS